jgi:hypothetical protein
MPNMFKGWKSKMGGGDSNKDKKAKPLPPRLTFTEQTQPNEYLIRSFDDLFSKTVRVWRGGDWNDNVKNGATGALFDSSHHVPGEGAKRRAAFKDGTFGFCLEWIDFAHEGKIHRVRCMNEFCVRSQQCTDHPKTVYKDGPNRIYDLMNRGETIAYGMIKDTGAAKVPLTDDQLKSKALGDLRDAENRLGEAANLGRDASVIQAEIVDIKRALSNKSYLLGDRQNAVSKPPVTAPIYNARKSVGNSGPGNAVLDAKARRNPNDTKKKGKTDYIKNLGGIQE